jgi:hypothetical protein
LDHLLRVWEVARCSFIPIRFALRGWYREAVIEIRFSIRTSMY